MEIYFNDLTPKAQQELLEEVGITNPKEMNWDMDILPIAIVEFDDDDEALPSTYAEVEYTSEQLESDPIAIEGAKWDDKNYQHYMER